MKLSKITLAVLAAVAGTAAVAAPNGSRIAITAGASATASNFFLDTASSTLKSLCGGTYSVLGSGNFRSAICATGAITDATYNGTPNANFTNFTGLPYAEVRINTEGSFSAVLLLNSTANGGSGAQPAVWDPVAAASSTTYPAGSVVVGGLLDLDPALGFPSTTIGTNALFPVTPVGMAQVFGVAVSDKLYTAMFNQQQAAGLIPPAPTCTVASTAVSYCVPSIAIAQMATLMADNPFNAAYANGVPFLVPGFVDVAPTPATPSGWVGAVTPGTCQTISGNRVCIPNPQTTTELRYARRVDNSGTQAAAQNYFLGLPCSKQVLSIVAEPTSDSFEEPGGLKDALVTKIRVTANPGTGEVRTELNRSTVTQAGPDGIIIEDQGTPADESADNVLINNYAIGVVSMENVQTGQSWKWLRVEGAAGADNASPASLTNRAAAEAGRYNFVFESVSMGGTAAGNTFWGVINATLGATARPGLIPSGTLATGYSKGGNSCQGWSSN